MRIRLSVLLAFLLAGFGAYAEPMPGLLDPAMVENLEHEAAGQKSAAQAAVRGHAQKLGYSAELIETALRPAMERSGHFRVTLGDGTEIEFPWYRTGFAENQLSNTGKAIARNKSGSALRRETNKGGVRLHYGVFADEVYALALKMDSKLATARDALEGDSFRGAKGGIGAGRVVKVGTRYEAKLGDFVDPAAPGIDRAEMMRKFGSSYRAAGGEVGPGLDIQAGDVNTKAPEMKVLAQTYGKDGVLSPGVSGKEVLRRASGEINPNGGIEFRAVSTGEGVWASALLAARRAGTKVRGATVVAQGWGEVGRAFGMAAARDGARVIAIEEVWSVGDKRVPGVLLNPHGEQATPKQTREWLAAVDALRSSGEDVSKAAGGRFAAFLRTDLGAAHLRADIVGVNALGDVLNKDSVPLFASSGTHQGRRKIIVEGANLAETAKGAELLDHHRAQLLTVPGDLANLGGVHVSNLEAAQNVFQEVVPNERARRSLKLTINAAWKRGMKLAAQHDVSERAAIELAAVDALMKRSLQLKGAPRSSVERRVISATGLKLRAR